MKYYVIKHLVLLKIQNIIDIAGVLRQWFIKFLILFKNFKPNKTWTDKGKKFCQGSRN